MLLALEEGRAPPTLMSQFQTRRDEQIGTFNVVDELDGLIVRMPGYILPLDYAERGQAREFLFLPYHGACIHYPPPPPNQIVYLRSAEPVSFSELWEPVWVEGRMAAHSLVEVHTHSYAFIELGKLGADRLRALTGDDLQAFIERQAGFHAADNDVDSVSEIAGELLLAARDKKSHDPARQAQPGNKPGRQDDEHA